jgi:hypothetical protein
MPKNVKNTPSNVDFDGVVLFLALLGARRENDSA